MTRKVDYHESRKPHECIRKYKISLEKIQILSTNQKKILKNIRTREPLAKTIRNTCEDM